MKTKTLLIAAAALAAGVISSQAQVYSQNIVGYVNVKYPAGINVLVATPLTTGNDVITNVLVGVPGATTIQVWNPGSASFDIYSYTGPASNRHWKDALANNADNLLLPPGSAYFVSCGGVTDFTNTYVGSLVANSGLTATNTLAPGVAVTVGSLLPYGGDVTNTVALNLVPPGATVLQKWDSVNQQFQIFSFTGPVSNRTWKDVANNVVVPQIGVAEGVFLTPGGVAAYPWIQTAP